MNRRYRTWRIMVVALLVALSSLVAACDSAPPPTGVAAATSELAGAPATTTPIKHMIVMMKSGRSFDHYFGTYPGADGIPANVCARLNTATASLKGCVAPFPLRERPLDALSDRPSVWRRQYNGGNMDGFVSAYRKMNLDGSTAMGYYDDKELPYYWNVADQYVLFDRFFSSATSGSRLNHFFAVTGGPTPLGSSQIPAEGYGDTPTIFDKLEEKGVSWKFYVEGYDSTVNFRTPVADTRALQLTTVPLLNFARFVENPNLASHIVDLSQYSKDLEAGTLPAVSYMATNAGSEAAPGYPDVGQRQTQRITNALAMSQYWKSSAFLLTYDGWGGLYDHVKPPESPDQYGYGFRVPTLLMSPYARQGTVNHTDLDYTGILKFIEDNWGISPLSTRDAASNGITSAFDFAAAPRQAMLLSMSRVEPVDLAPRRWVVFATYGPVFVVASILIGVLLRRGRSRPRHFRSDLILPEGISR